MDKLKLLLPLKVILFLLVFFLIGLGLFQQSETLSFHQDEFTFLERGMLLDFYLQREFDRPVWTNYVSYDVPKFGEFLYGAGLKLNYGQPVKDTLMEYDFLPGIEVSCSEKWYKLVSQDAKPIPELSDQYLAKMPPVLMARKQAVAMVILGLLFLFLASNLVDDWLYGLLTIGLLGFNPLFKQIGVRAMGDSPLFMFLMLYLYLHLFLVKSVKEHQPRNQTFWLGVISVVLGLAIGVKLNAVISLFHLFLSYYLIKWINQESLKQAGWQLLFVILSSFGIFAVFNPLVWNRPIKRSIQMAQYRFYLFDKQQQLFSQAALTGFLARIRAVFYKRFPDLSIIILLGLGYITFCKSKLKDEIKKYVSFEGLKQQLEDNLQAQRKFVLILWLGLSLVVTSLLIPMDWERYYLPILIVIVLIEAALVKKGVKLGAEYVRDKLELSI